MRLHNKRLYWEMSVIIWCNKYKFNKLHYITNSTTETVRLSLSFMSNELCCLSALIEVWREKSRTNRFKFSQISFRFWRLWWTSCRCYRKCVRTSKAKIKVSVFFLSWMPFLIFRCSCDIHNFHNVSQSNHLEIMKSRILFYPLGFDWIKKHGLSNHWLIFYN